MIAITDKDVIIGFLRGLSKDFLGRTYQDILEQSDHEMEKCHSAIQHIFPLHEFSKHAYTCPIITPEIVNDAKQYDTILDNLRKAKDRFEHFLGIGEYEDVDKQRKWCKDENHNLLRITRAIRCLRLFGLEDESQDFYGKVMAVGDKIGISIITKAYWDKALCDDVWKFLQE